MIRGPAKMILKRLDNGKFSGKRCVGQPATQHCAAHLAAAYKRNQWGHPGNWHSRRRYASPLVIIVTAAVASSADKVPWTT